MKFRPLHDRVVVRRVDSETKTSGGIIIPDTAAEKPQQAEVLAAATRLDESAMAVAMVIDHGIAQHVHPRVVTVADTEFGRVSITTSTSADGKQWMSLWPATAEAVREDLYGLLSAPRAAA